MTEDLYLKTLFRMQTCPICGKCFIVPSENRWRIQNKKTYRYIHVCSYHCMREWENHNK